MDLILFSIFISNTFGAPKKKKKILVLFRNFPEISEMWCRKPRVAKFLDIVMYMS